MEKKNEELLEKNNKQIDSIENTSKVKENEESNQEIKTLKKEKKKIGVFETIILLIIAVTVSMSLGMIIVGNKKPVEKPIKDKYLETFITNYNYIVDNYYEEVDKEKLINDAIAGMMNTLNDPYSTYISDDESNNFNINLQGNYKGLGVSIVKDPKTKYIMVYYTFKNSPADRAGLQTGDLIKSINGEITTEVDTSEFSKKILESNEIEYTFTIIRGEEEFDVTLAKENIEIDSVQSEIIEKEGKKIGYIYLSIFASNTASQFKNKLLELEKEDIDSLIIDVRSNTGGHLTAVEEILKSLLTQNQITYKVDDNGKLEEYYGSLKENKKYEIVLLGNEYSASASEVLILSLKDNLDSKFIGIKTYGKGTVQELITLTNGAQYKITTKKWLSPKGTWVNENEGIDPDIEVQLNEKYYQTYDREDDNQLQTAIDYIINE